MLLGTIAGLSMTGPLQASELRFSATAAGNIVATGNAVGLSKELDANGPGTLDSVGTFASLDPNAVDDAPVNVGNPWFAGTTNDWTQAGTEAVLVLPDQHEVLHAELVWGGSTLYGTEDVTAFVDDPVTLSFGGDILEVTPDPATALDIQETSISGFAANDYVRSADVTDFVAEHGAGAYLVSGIPATQDSTINSLNAGGWTLIVAYRSSSEPIRNMTIFVGGSFVDEGEQEDYLFEGFCTPPSGDFQGRVIVSALEGDADRVGDSLAIAPTAADTFVILEGPNNPADNFFASQINGSDGMVDVAGTFGMRNHDAAAGTNVSGGRQGWDVTTIAVGSDAGHLGNGQTSAVLRTQTAGDSFIPTLVGFGIQVNAPDFSGGGTGAAAAPSAVMLDQTTTITIDLENVGLVDADDVILTAPLPEGLALESFTLDGNEGDVDGDPVDAAALTSGVAIGDVPFGTSRQVQMVVRSVGEPTHPSGDYVIEPAFEYAYVSCVGEPPLSEPHALPTVLVDFVGEESTTSGVDESTGDGADETAEDTSASASASADDTTTGADGDATATDTDGSSDSAGAGTMDDSGCGCRSSAPPTGWALLLLGLGGLAARRRPRSGRI